MVENGINSRYVGINQKGKPAKNRIDLTGQVFGRLTVIGPHSITPRKKLKWLCKCSCGTYTVVFGYSLKRNDGQSPTRSCGCLLVDIIKARNARYNETEENTTTENITSRNTTPVHLA